MAVVHGAEVEPHEQEIPHLAGLQPRVACREHVAVQLGRRRRLALRLRAGVLQPRPARRQRVVHQSVGGQRVAQLRPAGADHLLAQDERPLGQGRRRHQAAVPVALLHPRGGGAEHERGEAREGGQLRLRGASDSASGRRRPPALLALRAACWASGPRPRRQAWGRQGTGLHAKAIYLKF